MYQSPCRRHQPAVLLLPIVVGRRADPRLTADLLDQNPFLALTQHKRDLAFAELRCLHCLPRSRPGYDLDAKRENFNSNWSSLRGAGHRPLLNGLEFHVRPANQAPEAATPVWPRPSYRACHKMLHSLLHARPALSVDPGKSRAAKYDKSMTWLVGVWRRGCPPLPLYARYVRHQAQP